MKTYPLEIPGFRAATPEVRAVETPFDRSAIAEVELAPAEAMPIVLANASSAARGEWRKTPAWKRAAILRKTAALIRGRHEELALLIASEGGKPLKDARVEVSRAGVTLEECASVCERLEGRQWDMQRAPGTENRIAFTIPEPIGVVLAISAFNHPLNLACHQAGAAIGAGNACILKPATSTPVSSIELARMMREAGLPDGVLQVVPTPGSRAGALVASPVVGFITFIGSAEMGWRIRREAADGTRMAAEHGGNAATIVLADADLDRAIPIITRGSFYHAGQVCVSTQRLYVERAIEPEFTTRLLAASTRLVCGDARKPETDVGALIEPGEVSRVHEWVGEARAAGAEVLLGGNPLSRTLYPTTILRNAPESARVITHEIFGPVVVVQVVDSLEEGIERVNGSHHPFQSSVFTRDIDRAFRAARAVDAAAFMINDMTAFRVDWMPFGGRKLAGLGMGGVEASIHEMTEQKLIVVNAQP
jgi:acyl-CoA reductase-like NAD-dependent aldehyde dehydrogenase